MKKVLRFSGKLVSAFTFGAAAYTGYYLARGILGDVKPKQIHFTQNIYSPEALDPSAIFAQTERLLNQKAANDGE